MLALPLQAIVWRGDIPEVQTEAKDEMKQVGKVYYSQLKFFGGSCVALGGKWVLTSRHGTDKWKAGFLKVEFPALSKKIYEIEKIHFPKTGDLALLELKRKVKGAKEIPTFGRKEPKKNQRAWIGGFGLAGKTGKVDRSGDFHAGHNRVDGMRGGKISISLSKADDKTCEPQECVLAMFDSGSPIFLETSSGWQLAGIASTATNTTNPKEGDRGGYAPIYPALSWMKKLVKP